MTSPKPSPKIRRTADEQLILDLAVMWLGRYHHARTLPRGNVFDPADPAEELWRTYAVAVSDGWTVLYLLALLRTHAPEVAARAAHYLNVGAPSQPGDRLPLFVHEWARAIRDGRSLLTLLP